MGRIGISPSGELAMARSADAKVDWNGATENRQREVRTREGRGEVLATIGETRLSIYNTFAVCEFEMGLRVADGRRFGDLVAAARPGAMLAQRDGAVCVRTRDGAIWITRARLPRSFKRCAVDVLSQAGVDFTRVPQFALPLDAPRLTTFQEIRVEVADEIGWLYFNMSNGAMSVDRLQRLTRAFGLLGSRKPKVVVLMNDQGNHWSNGLDLNAIHAAQDPEGETLRNLRAINDLVRAIRSSTCRTVAAVNGDAGAGGVFLAMGCDQVFARSTVVLNPHYMKMGLTGSEFHTLTLPDRVGQRDAKKLLEECKPLGAERARQIGLVDDFRTEARRVDLEPRPGMSFQDEIRTFAAHARQHDARNGFLHEKQQRVASPQFAEAMDACEERELARMKECVYGNRYGYREKRAAFVR
jgi:putative two-component system hydrogenase maturation factor HypX/HoxX